MLVPIVCVEHAIPSLPLPKSSIESSSIKTVPGYTCPATDTFFLFYFLGMCISKLQRATCVFFSEHLYSGLVFLIKWQFFLHGVYLTGLFMAPVKSGIDMLLYIDTKIYLSWKMRHTSSQNTAPPLPQLHWIKETYTVVYVCVCFPVWWCNQQIHNNFYSNIQTMYSQTKIRTI